MASAPHKATITIDGKSYSVQPGVLSVPEIAAIAGVKKCIGLTVSYPEKPTKINANGSVEIGVHGGEVITTTQGV